MQITWNPFGFEFHLHLVSLGVRATFYTEQMSEADEPRNREEAQKWTVRGQPDQQQETYPSEDEEQILQGEWRRSH